jgi:phosphoribosylformylglycinamidine synthase
MNDFQQHWISLGRGHPAGGIAALSSPPMKATVIVELKPSVLDPQGKAIQHSLSSLGFAGVEDVRVGKLFRFTLADSGQNRDHVESQLRQMCERLLANTVIEHFSYTLEE